ncbi:MAG: lipase family protein [Chloroflexota bacterium]
MAIVIAALATVAVVAVVAFVAVVRKAQPSRPGSFYSLPAPLPKKPLGTVVRSEVLGGLPPGARGWKILYMSTSYTGKPTAVSGMVIVPARASSGLRPVVAFANGTVGVASNCALSIQGAKHLDFLHGLRAYLDAGDAAVMTDYQGLGTPGPHPYLVGRSEAETVLDSVRAAHNLTEAHAGRTFAVTGPSQGGHAALFTGQLAATYAPDLKLVGVAASAPPTDLKELFRLKVERPFGKVLSAFALDAWSHAYGHNLDNAFTPVARPIVRRMLRLCIHNETQVLGFFPLTQILKIGYLKSLPWKTEPWKTDLEQNTPGKTKIPAPVLISQGDADLLVHPPVTAAFVKHLCAMGEKVEYRVYPGVVHDAGAQSASNVAAWIADRFAGKIPPSNC